MRKLTRKIKIRKFIEKYGFILTSINQLDLKKQYLLIEQPNCDLVAKEVKSFTNFKQVLYVPVGISVEIYPVFEIKKMLDANVFYYKNGVKYTEEEYRIKNKKYVETVCKAKVKGDFNNHLNAIAWGVISEPTIGYSEWFALKTPECINFFETQYSTRYWNIVPRETQIEIFTQENKNKFSYLYEQYILSRYLEDNEDEEICIKEWLATYFREDLTSFV